jgi:hypothetical protein
MVRFGLDTHTAGAKRMPPVSHEPSSLIALRDLHALEQQRRDAERARQAAEAEARAAAEAEARRQAAEREAAERAAAERARREQQRRDDEERLRVAELEARVRGLQAAHLANVESELKAASRDVRRARARDGLISAAAFGVVGLGLALLFQALDRPPAPELAVPDDPGFSEAQREIERIRGKIHDLESDNEAARAALAEALSARPAAPVEPAPTAAPARPRPRPTTPRPQSPTATPTPRGGHLPGGICDTDDPLAENCDKK